MFLQSTSARKQCLGRNAQGKKTLNFSLWPIIRNRQNSIPPRLVYLEVRELKLVCVTPVIPGNTGKAP